MTRHTLTALLLLTLLLGTVLSSRADAPEGIVNLYLPLVMKPTAGTPASTTRVSVAPNGTQGNERSVEVALSADGRYVAFTSLANNLVPGDTNGHWDIFVRDQQTGAVTRVSVASNGTQGNDSASRPAITPDGRYVSFTSLASNLVANDSNGFADVFVHDRVTGQTTLVSVGAGGVGGNGLSRHSGISADGRYIAFASLASNFVAGDANATWDVFLRDRTTGQTSCISCTGGATGNGASDRPAISADGRTIAFLSGATNLSAGDGNGATDILVRDQTTGQITRVSLSSAGAEGNGGSYDPTISADGHYVAFLSQATNLVAGDTNGVYDVFVRDRQANQTTRVSVSSGGAQSNAASYLPRLSADGRYVTFDSAASTLVAGDSNGVSDVFLHDRTTTQTTRVSVASDGTQGNGDSVSGTMGAGISADGRFISFTSSATNLVAGDTNGVSDAFMRDRGVP